MTDKVSYQRFDVIAVLTIDHPPVNALSQKVRRALLDRLLQAENDPGVKAVVIVGAGRAFIAGADITEFGKPPQSPLLPDVCNRIEASPLIVVAAMHGVTLGGGLEVALSAHYRLAHPAARIGLPEVRLGLIPGAGGTQRLPRLTGVEAAVDLITSGRQIDAREAERLGIIDRTAEGVSQDTGLAYARSLLDAGADRRAVADLPPPEPRDWDAIYERVLRKGRGQIAPAEAVRAIQASVELPFAEGLNTERAIFENLMKTDQRQGMIHAFFAERAVSKLPELNGIAPRPIAKIGLVGGGTMGAGIATAALLSGLPVVLLERDRLAADAARERIAANLSGAVTRGKIDKDGRDRILAGVLSLATDYGALADVDLVIEAVFEDMAVKKAVFAALDASCKPGAILASNTSYLDLDEIAAATSRPQDVIGLHFFSPAHVMKLLEVVVPAETSLDVMATGFDLGRRLRKIAVRAGVCDGFIGNRILNSYRTAADHMVLDGASPFDIDAAVTEFGFAMGPFAVSDLAGLDIGRAMRKRRAATRDPRERVGRYADKLCEAGHFGRKTGKGFYLYKTGERSGTPNRDVLKIIAAERKDRGITPRGFAPAEIVRRYLAAMVNEAAKAVQEGIARRPMDVDVVLVAGYGFPRHWGGPCKWADLTGLEGVLADIKAFAEEDAYFWSPAPLLKELVAKGRSFGDLNE
jgi:3-hydroxyacyl-CoA dehydrogenase